MLTDEQLKALTQDQILELKGKLESLTAPKVEVAPVAPIDEPTPVLPKEPVIEVPIVEQPIHEENPQVIVEPKVDLQKVMEDKMAEYNKSLESKLTSFSTQFENVIKEQRDAIEKLSKENAELRRTNPTGIPTPKTVVDLNQPEVQGLKTANIAKGIYGTYRN